MYFGTVTQPAAWHSDPSKEWNVVQVKRIMYNFDSYALNKTVEISFFSAVNLATEKVKNWNLSMEDFKQLKDAGVNSIWKWKYFMNCVGYWSNEAFKCYCGSFFIFIIIFFYSLRAFSVERRKLGVNK